MILRFCKVRRRGPRSIPSNMSRAPPGWQPAFFMACPHKSPLCPYLAPAAADKKLWSRTKKEGRWVTIWEIPCPGLRKGRAGNKILPSPSSSVKDNKDHTCLKFPQNYQGWVEADIWMRTCEMLKEERFGGVFHCRSGNSQKARR